MAPKWFQRLPSGLTRTKSKNIYLALLGLLVMATLIFPWWQSVTRVGLWTGEKISGFATRLFYPEKSWLTRARMCEDTLTTIDADETKKLLLQKENLVLKRLLGYTNGLDSMGVTAKVIGSLNDNWETGFWLDQGKNQEVVLGSAVVSISEQGVVQAVGEITRVFNDRSFVTVITGEEQKLTITLNDGDEIIGIVSGTGGENLRLEFVPNFINLKLGDVLFTSGIDEGWPSGIFVGTIIGLTPSSGSVLQSATVTTANSIFLLDWVIVIPQLNL